MPAGSRPTLPLDRYPSRRRSPAKTPAMDFQRSGGWSTTKERQDSDQAYETLPRSGPTRQAHNRCHRRGPECGVTVEPTGAGTFSYYEQADDFLALHRDVDSCDVTLN
jgi:hypothetical protein